MAAVPGREADAVSFFAALAEAPYRYDFYQTLRTIECLYEDKPRWGSALRPVDEPLRLGQEPDLSFAPAPLASYLPSTEGRPARLHVRLFGLLGPNGPMPIHFTDYVRERARLAGDLTLSRFLDLFHHRFIALFYRAWAHAQPHVNRDRPRDDRFTKYVGAFAGIAPPAFHDRDAVPDLAKLFHAGTLIRHVKNAEGLASILQHFFDVSVGVEEFVAHWLPLGPRERTYLGREGAVLGQGGVLGARVWDRQHKFRLHLGPLTLSQYESFLPVSPEARRGEGGNLEKLVDWVRQYLCFELDWDVRLLLARREVPSVVLGRRGRLGWTTWLGQRRADTDADDLCLNAEACVASAGVRTYD